MKKLIFISLMAVAMASSAQSSYKYGASSFKEVTTATAAQTGFGISQSKILSSSNTKVDTIYSNFTSTSAVDSNYQSSMYAIGSNNFSTSSASSDGYIKTVAKTGGSENNNSFYTGIMSTVDGGLYGIASGINFKSSASKGQGGNFYIGKVGTASITFEKTNTGHSLVTNTVSNMQVVSAPITVDSTVLDAFTFMGQSGLSTTLSGDSNAK